VSCPFEHTFQDGPSIFRPCSLCSGFVLSVLLLSSTPATVSPISPRIVPHFRVYCENSTGFDVNSIAVRFVSNSVLLLSYTPATVSPIFSDLLLIFVVFRGDSTAAVLLLSCTPATVFDRFFVFRFCRLQSLRSLRIVSTVLLSSLLQPQSRRRLRLRLRQL
jgi:hypothetical protein